MFSKPISFLAQKKRVLHPKENRFWVLAGHLSPICALTSAALQYARTLQLVYCVRPVMESPRLRLLSGF